jgi:uncharacterized protein YndB with AHSA1/START domain
MTAISPDGPSLKHIRRIRAAPEEVFEAFVDPRELVHWWGPDEGPTLCAETDLRVGGSFRVAFRTMDGELHETQGEYLEIDAPRRLVMAFWWSDAPHVRSRVTVSIDPVDDGARLTVLHEGFADTVSRDSHEVGWAGALDKLATLAESAHEKEGSGSPREEHRRIIT